MSLRPDLAVDYMCYRRVQRHGSGRPIGRALQTGNEKMGDKVLTEWNGASVRKWLESRVIASRADQAAAERAGRGQQDDCDKSTAEDMVCSIFQDKDSANDQNAFAEDLRAFLDRDEYIWRGVYDDTRFDRHVRSYIRKLIKMAKTNDGFEKTGRYR